MANLSRRKFVALTGTAAGTMIVGQESLLHGEPALQRFALAGSGETSSGASSGALKNLIFPEPKEISASGEDFLLDSQVAIAVPSRASEQDLLLAVTLKNELCDRFGVFLKIERLDTLPSGTRVILMGSLQNPLVRQHCAKQGLIAAVQSHGSESYALRSSKNLILVAGNDDRGAFYGLQSLRQLIEGEDRQAKVRGVRVDDWPDKPFRGIYLYLPGRDNIAFFKRFIRDFMALYKYNTLIMEMNACMRLESHPELNYGWIQFARDTNYSCRNYPPHPFHNVEQNSSHQDAADSGFLEKEEVADLASWVRKYHIELVPELASFTHSYYLLTEHRDLAAIPQHKWPDIYCAANPKTYPLVYEVYDEFTDLLKPRSVHIGHDELFLPVDVSPQCHDRNIAELYGQDVKKIHDHLAAKGIKTQFWGDMLLESVRGHGLSTRTARDGWTYSYAGAMTPEQVERLIPKDCLIYNWFWGEDRDWHGKAEFNEEQLDKMGFQQIYGNLQPTVQNYETRKKRTTLLGGAPSAWFATNEVGFGKDLLSTFLGCSSLLWTGHVMPSQTLAEKVQSLVHVNRIRMSGAIPPSKTETAIVPVDISRSFNTSESIPALEVNLDGMTNEAIRYKKVPFDLKNSGSMRVIAVGTAGKQGTSLPREVTGIQVGEAPTSLVFLHASARQAANRQSYRVIWDQADTADMLGWYEVVYEDGFVTTIPIRYGVNISEWSPNLHTSAKNYCYEADAVEVGGPEERPITFFAYEWTNPRLGKVIHEIRLKGTSGFRGASPHFTNDYGPVIDSNAVMLAALSLVRKRS